MKVQEKGRITAPTRQQTVGVSFHLTATYAWPIGIATAHFRGQSHIFNDLDSALPLGQAIGLVLLAEGPEVFVATQVDGIVHDRRCGCDSFANFVAGDDLELIAGFDDEHRATLPFRRM